MVTHWENPISVKFNLLNDESRMHLYDDLSPQPFKLQYVAQADIPRREGPGVENLLPSTEAF